MIYATIRAIFKNGAIISYEIETEIDPEGENPEEKFQEWAFKTVKEVREEGFTPWDGDGIEHYPYDTIEKLEITRAE